MLSNGKKGGKMNEYVGGNTKRARGQNGQRGKNYDPGKHTAKHEAGTGESVWGINK